MLQLVVLGAGCALPQPGLGPAGYALSGEGLDGVTLFDCGPGSVRALGSAGIELGAVTRVVISHFHTDHVLDLFALLFARRNPHIDAASLRELEIIGPVGLVGLLARWGPPAAAVVTEVAAGDALERGTASFRSARARHSPEALAWRLDAAQLSVTYSGDSGECDELRELAVGTDLLIADCSFGPDEEPVMHMHALAAARTAQSAGAKCLLLSHFYPHVDPARAAQLAAAHFSGKILTAADGMRLQVGPGAP